MLVETSDDGPREVRGWNLRIQKEASRELQSWAWHSGGTEKNLDS